MRSPWQRPKETTALLRRLSHAPVKKIAAAKAELAASDPLEFYPLETFSRENHTAVVGESGSGKSLLRACQKRCRKPLFERAVH